MTILQSLWKLCYNFWLTGPALLLPMSGRRLLHLLHWAGIKALPASLLFPGLNKQSRFLSPLRLCISSNCLSDLQINLLSFINVFLSLGPRRRHYFSRGLSCAITAPLSQLAMISLIQLCWLCLPWIWFRSWHLLWCCFDFLTKTVLTFQHCWAVLSQCQDLFLFPVCIPREEAGGLQKAGRGHSQHSWPQ